MIDFTSIPRDWLTCRAWQHSWDHGPAPLQEDRSVEPVVWVTRGVCTHCKTKRHRYFRVGDALPISEWSYDHPESWRVAMRLITQMQARAEIARRDLTGEKDDHKVASLRKTKSAVKFLAG